MTEVATPVEQPTEAEIQRHYSAALDSVNLLNAGKPEGMDDAEWADCVKRNVEHLEIQLGKTYYAGYDLQPFRDAIAKSA